MSPQRAWYTQKGDLRRLYRRLYLQRCGKDKEKPKRMVKYPKAVTGGKACPFLAWKEKDERGEPEPTETGSLGKEGPSTQRLSYAWQTSWEEARTTTTSLSFHLPVACRAPPWPIPIEVRSQGTQLDTVFNRSPGWRGKRWQGNLEGHPIRGTSAPFGLKDVHSVKRGSFKRAMGV